MTENDQSAVVTSPAEAAWPKPAFLFATCQYGAEQALKDELAAAWPDFRFSYSRKGFLTFRLPPEASLPADFALKSIFARTYGFTLGKAQGATLADRAADVWRLAEPLPIDAVHVWPRDGIYRPSEDPPAWLAEAPQAVQAAAPERVRQAAKETHSTDDGSVTTSATTHGPPTSRGALVLDCVLVSEDEWWVAYHRARSGTSRWPGGFRPLTLPSDAVSRAWLKMEEALQWSTLPLAEGDRCVELGASPGGAAQALLARGLMVYGVDPAKIDPRVLANPNFTHINKRAKEVPKKALSDVRWLMADMNVAPNYTLDAIEDIVINQHVHLDGLLITLKLVEWTLARDIPLYLDRIRAWGFKDVRARQLYHNRQEICVAALRKNHMR